MSHSKETLPKDSATSEKERLSREIRTELTDLSKDVTANLAVDLPEGAREEIINNILKIRQSSIESPFIAESGRAYVNKGDKIFYNSTPDKDNNWGEITEVDTVYILFENDFHLRHGVGSFVHDPRYTYKIYHIFQIDGDESELFDDKGYPFQKENGLWHKRDPEKGDIYYKKGADGYIDQCDRDGITQNEHKKRLYENLRREFPEIVPNPDYYHSLTEENPGSHYDIYMNIEGTNYYIGAIMETTFQNGEIRVQVLYGMGGPFVSLDEFKSNVREVIALTKEKVELGSAIDQTPESDRIKLPYFNQLKRLHDVHARLSELTRSADDFQARQRVQNLLVWFTVEMRGTVVPYAEVKSYADDMEKELEHPLINPRNLVDWTDTLMRYYDQSGNREKAVFYARKMIDFDPKKTGRIPEEYKIAAQEVLNR